MLADVQPPVGAVSVTHEPQVLVVGLPPYSLALTDSMMLPLLIDPLVPAPTRAPLVGLWVPPAVANVVVSPLNALASLVQALLASVTLILPSKYTVVNAGIL